MNNIEHRVWLRVNEFGRVRVIRDEQEAERVSAAGWTLEGPLVPAEQLQGAVAALQQIADEASLAPMEDVLGAGVLACKALKEVGSDA